HAPTEVHAVRSVSERCHSVAHGPRGAAVGVAPHPVAQVLRSDAVRVDADPVAHVDAAGAVIAGCICAVPKARHLCRGGYGSQKQQHGDEKPPLSLPPGERARISAEAGPVLFFFNRGEVWEFRKNTMRLGMQNAPNKRGGYGP